MLQLTTCRTGYIAKMESSVRTVTGLLIIGVVCAVGSIFYKYLDTLKVSNTVLPETDLELDHVDELLISAQYQAWKGLNKNFGPTTYIYFMFSFNCFDWILHTKQKE